MISVRALAIVLLLAACAPARTRVVTVPKTDAAMKCWRECKLINATCEGSAVDETMEQRQFRCSREQSACLLTCPGAREEWR